jgi:hypothetical protein
MRAFKLCVEVAAIWILLAAIMGLDYGIVHLHALVKLF